MSFLPHNIPFALPTHIVMKGMANDNNSSANSMLRCQRKIIVIYRPNGVISKQTEIVATRFAFFQFACSSGDADPRRAP